MTKSFQVPRGQLRKKAAPAAAFPTPSPPTITSQAAEASQRPPPTATQAASDLALEVVEPSRFVDAVQAALRVGATYCNPYDDLLFALAERLDEPTSLGLPDPFAPALRVLAHALYGANRAYWDETTRVFCKHYQWQANGQPPSSPRENDAARRRWQALSSLAEIWQAALRDGRLAKRTTSQGWRQAAALVAAAIRAPLRPAGAPAASGREEGCFGVDRHGLEPWLTKHQWSPDLPVPVLETLWNGLGDPRLPASRQAFELPTQWFLAFLVTRVGSYGVAPAQTYRVQSEEFARWARLDLTLVRETFTQTSWRYSPAHELATRRVVLPDWRWSDPAACAPLDLPWLEAPPLAGQTEDGCWLEVTLNRELLPCLRRLGLYCQQIPQVLAACEH